MSKNLSELSGRKGIEDNLFDKLGKLSVNEGTPSKKELQQLADEFLVGSANTYGTATFYDFMKPENKGMKAYVCNGTACVCSGKQDAVKTELKKHLKEGRKLAFRDQEYFVAHFLDIYLMHDDEKMVYWIKDIMGKHI